MSKTRAVAVQRGQLCLPESVANHMYPVQRLLNTRATVLMEGRSPLAHCLLGDATAAEMVTWGITPPFTSCLERILMDIRELCLPDRLIDRSTDRPTSATVWIGEVPLCSVPRFTCLFHTLLAVQFSRTPTSWMLYATKALRRRVFGIANGVIFQYCDWCQISESNSLGVTCLDMGSVSAVPLCSLVTIERYEKNHPISRFSSKPVP